MLPVLINRAGESAAKRFLEFFAVYIRNPRAAYGRAAGAFLRWCEVRGIAELRQVQPVHVAAYVEQLGRERSFLIELPTPLNIRQGIPLKSSQRLSQHSASLHQNR